MKKLTKAMKTQTTLSKVEVIEKSIVWLTEYVNKLNNKEIIERANKEVIEKSIVWLTEYVNKLNNKEIIERANKVNKPITPSHNFKVGDKIEFFFEMNRYTGIICGIGDSWVKVGWEDSTSTTYYTNDRIFKILKKVEKVEKVEDKPLHDFKVNDEVECFWNEVTIKGIVTKAGRDRITVEWETCGPMDYLVTKDNLFIKKIKKATVHKYAVNDLVLMNPLMYPDLQVMKIIKVLPSNDYYMKFVTNDIYLGEYSEKDILRKIGVAI